MLPGLETMAVAGWLTLAAAGDPSARVTCSVPEAPAIKIVPVTAPIKYDFSKSEEQLTNMPSNTISPYALNADTVTRGLRHDQPKINLKMEWGIQEYPATEVFCMWYHSITINIKLSPIIYVAKEYGKSECQKAVLEHERKHVAVDRDVINRHAMDIGKTLQDAVNKVGAIGPYQGKNKQDDVQKMLSKYIEGAFDSESLLLQEDMRKSQAAVDSLDEYERVNAICRKEEAARRR